MGSKFCKKGFCATCVKCKKSKAKEATAEVSVTPSAAQTSAEASARIVNQFPTQTREGSEQGNDETQTRTQTTKEIGEAQPDAGALQETEVLSTGKRIAENGSIQPTAQVTEKMEAKLIGKVTLWYPAELQPAAGTVQEGEPEVLSAGEAKTVEQVREDDLQDTEACTASKTVQDTREAIPEGRCPYAQLMESTNGAPLAVELLQEDEVQNAAQATEETEAARDHETQPFTEISESFIRKTEPQFATQITEESEICSNAEHMQDTNGAQCSGQTGQLTVKDQFSQAMEESGSQANVQAVRDTILGLASAETKPENTVQSIVQDTSIVSAVGKVPEKNAVESVSHPSDPARQEKQPAVQVRQKRETWYGAEMTELNNVQWQQSIKHPRGLGALQGDGAEEGDCITTEQDQVLELETSSVTVQEQKQVREKSCLQEKVPNSIAGTDAPVNPVLGRQEVDSQVLEASIPEMHKSKGEEETANAETLSGLETRGSEGEVIPDSGPRSSNNEAAHASEESQSTEAADCICGNWSPSRRASFVCCCSTT